MDADLLIRARDTFRAAAKRAGAKSNESTESIAEPLACLATLACALTSRPPALWSTNAERLPYTTQGAKRSADTARQRLGFDEISPRYTLAGELPAKLNTLVFSVDQPSVASACALIDGSPLLVVAGDLGYLQLTACAREFGQLLAMASRTTNGNDARITLRSTSRRPGPAEHFAANFAIELLIPTTGLARALRRVRELLKIKNRALGDIEMLYLAQIFGVTFSDIARKCERARLLPLGGAGALGRFLDERFGGPEKRARDLGLPERPRVEFPLAPRSFLSTLKTQIVTAKCSHELAANVLGVSPHTLTAALATVPSSSERLWQ